MLLSFVTFAIMKMILRHGFGMKTFRKHNDVIYRNVFGCKNPKISIDFYIFLIFAQNIDCGF